MDAGLVEAAEILDGGIRTAHDVRRASSVEIATDLVSIVERCLDAIQDGIARFFGVDLTGREGPSFLRYPEGGFYRPHRDRGASPSWPGAALRKIAVVVFLNSSLVANPGGEFTGGALQLHVDSEPMDIDPLRGLLVAFPADVLHQVTIVGRGRRDAVVDWYY